MSTRLDYYAHTPDAVKKLVALQGYVEQCGLEKSLIELVKLRASQINGCAYCIDMHTREAAEAGETQQRLHGLIAWRECPFYTDRERAALAWTESVTLINHDHVPDELYDSAMEHFTERELADLTWAVIAINSWNRLAISFRKMPGD